MSMLNKIASYSPKFRELQKKLEAQKQEIRQLKEDRKQRKAKAEKKLAETVAALQEKQLGIYPIPRLLVAQPTSLPLAERILELAGLILAARLARRSVCADWRDGALDRPGKNAFYSYFRSSPELLRRDLAEVDSYFSLKSAPALPPPAQTDDEALEAWRTFFLFESSQPNQVLNAPADPWWRQRLSKEWINQLTSRGKVRLDDVERMAVLSLFRPKRSIRALASKAMEGLNINDYLGVYLPMDPSEDPTDQSLTDWVAQALVTHQRKRIWLLTDSLERQAAFTRLFGDAVVPLVIGEGAVTTQREAGERLLAGYLALSHAPFLALAGRPGESRLIYLISGLRERDMSWLYEPQAALFSATF